MSHRPIDDVHIAPSAFGRIRKGAQRAAVAVGAMGLGPDAIGDEVVRERPDGRLEIAAPVGGMLFLYAVLEPEEWVWTP